MKNIFLHILIPIFLNIVGEVYLKMTLNNLPHSGSSLKFLFTAFQSFDIVLASLFILVSSLLWIWALSKYQLSYLYPFMSINYIGILIACNLILNEPILLKHYLATVCITVGLFFISKSKEDTIKSSNANT